MNPMTIEETQQLANKTGKSYKWQGQVVQPQKTGLVNSLLDIVRKPVGSLLEATVAYPLHGLAQIDRANKGQAMQDYTPTFTDYQTAKNMGMQPYQQYNPSEQADTGKQAMEIGKAALGIGSFMAPTSLGAGLKGILGGGALTGAMGSAAQTDTEKGFGGMLENALGGAVTGAGTAGLLYGGGKALGRLGQKATTKAGQLAAKKTAPLTSLESKLNASAKARGMGESNKLTQFGLGTKLEKGIGSVESGKLANEYAGQFAGSTAQKLKNIQGRYDDLNEILSGAVTGSDKVIKSGDIYDIFTTTIGQNEKALGSSKTKDFLKTLAGLEDVNGNVRVADLADELAKLKTQLGGTKLEKLSSDSLEIAMAKEAALDNVVKEAVPEVRTLLAEMGTAKDASRLMIPSVNRGATAKIPYSNLGANIQGPATSATDFLGRLPSKIKGAASAVTENQKLMEVLGKTLPVVGGVAQKVSPYATKVSPSIANYLSQQGQDTQATTPVVNLPDTLTQKTQTSSKNMIDAQQYNQAVLEVMNAYGLTDIAKAKSIVDTMLAAQGMTGPEGAGDGGKLLPASQVRALGDIKTSLGLGGKMLEKIQSSDAFDPITGGIRSINPYDAKVQEIQAMSMLGNQIIGKALEGGVLRKEDTAKYQKILPQITDTKESAINKMQMLLSQIQDNYSVLVDAYREAGYNPTAGSAAGSTDSTDLSNMISGY